MNPRESLRAIDTEITFVFELSRLHRGTPPFPVGRASS